MLKNVKISSVGISEGKDDSFFPQKIKKLEINPL